MTEQTQSPSKRIKALHRKANSGEAISLKDFAVELGGRSPELKQLAEEWLANKAGEKKEEKPKAPAPLPQKAPARGGHERGNHR